MIVPIPAASTASIWSSRSTSTSTWVVWDRRAIAPCSAAVTETPFSARTARWLSLAITASESE